MINFLEELERIFMGHIHICLVSEQTIPNILGIAQFLPEEVIFCSTVGMEEKGKTDAILAALGLHGFDYFSRHRRVLVEHNSFADCERAFLELRGEYDGRQVILNLTGGTKIMALAAAGIFRGKSATHIYTPLPLNEYLQIYPCKEEQKTNPLTLRLTVDAYAAAYGVTVANPDEARFLTACALSNEPLCAFIAENYLSLEGLLGELYFRLMNFRNDQSCRVSFRYIPRDRSEARFLEMLGSPKGVVDRCFNKYEVRFLTGDWLSDYCYNELRKLAVDDVVTGMELVNKDGSNNEFDVLFTKDNALYIVECKSLKQKNDKDANILYKISALQQNFGLRVDGFLVSTARSILNNRGEIKMTIRQRAMQCNTEVIHPGHLNCFGAWIGEQVKGL